MSPRRSLSLLTLVGACLLTSGSETDAGSPPRRRPLAPTAVRAEVPAGFDRNANAPTSMLGTFYPTPYIIVRGDGPTGAGYSPLGQYGLGTTTLYGPISAYRATSAPVRVYSRGYDGRVIEREGTSFSTPYRPEASPVIYPTPNSYYYRPRRPNPSADTPSPINWLDQN